MIRNLAKDVAAPGVQTKKELDGYRNGYAIQATVRGAGAVSATVKIEASNDGNGWFELHSISLTGTGANTNGVVGNGPWGFLRANITAVSGGLVDVLVSV